MKSLIVSLFALFVFNNCYAQMRILNDTNSTMLWAIINMHQDTSYLFGTFHEFGNSFIDSHPKIKKYRGTKYIILESIHDKVNKELLVRDWRKYYKREEREDINNFLKRIGVGYKLHNVKNLPPSWVAYSILSELYKIKCNVKTAKDLVPMDDYIRNYGISYNKPLIGLESPLDTFGVIKLMMGGRDSTDSSGVGLVKDLALNTEEYLKKVDSQCWEVENYRALKINYKFGVYSEMDDPEFGLFLDKRNEAWLPSIKAVVDTSTAFIAVGLKHLFYQKGLIIQLQKAGYTIIPINIANREDNE